jgi:hypothetical protein
MLVRATRDRADILHLAGRRRLSPAVQDGTPALIPVSDRRDRCGWKAFFAALDARGWGVREEPDGPVRVGPRPAG